MSTKTNKAIVRRYIEQIWNGGRVNLIEEFFSEDIIEHLAGMPSRSRLSIIKESIVSVLNAFPDLKLSINDEIAEGDKVVQRWTLNGTQQTAFMSIPATGNQVTYSGVSIFRLNNARIVEIWLQADTLGMMQQLGVIPTIEAV